MIRNTLFRLLAATVLLTVWVGPVLAADYDVTLSFELLGQKKYNSSVQTSLTLNGQRCLAYELDGVARDGKVYFLPESRQLLLEDATIEYDKADPVILCFSTVHIDLLLKGSCTLTGKGTLISTKGAVTISAFPDEAASLSLSTPQTAIQCATRLAVNHVDVSCPESCYGFSCTGGRYADSWLTIDGGTLSLKSAKECVTGFKDIITIGCGLPYDEYKDQRMVYNKTEFQLTQNDNPCTELPLVNNAPYIPINTKDFSGKWVSQDVKPEVPDGYDVEQQADEEPVMEEEPVAEEEPVTEEVPVVKDEKIFDVCEEMPQFAEGGIAASYQFINENIQYPEIAREVGVQGRVYVRFVVETDGTITDAVVIKSVDPSLDKEALRVVKLSSGLWRPAKQNGSAVRCRYTMPVTFRLTEEVTK